MFSLWGIKTGVSQTGGGPQGLVAQERTSLVLQGVGERGRAKWELPGHRLQLYSETHSTSL